MKQCSCCGEFKTRFRNRQTRCRDCENKKNLERYHARYRSDERHLKNTYRYSLKKNYGIDEKFFNDMWSAQSGKCVICHEAVTNIFLDVKAKRCALDHCHKTGRIRSILCHTCNSSIGMIGDNLENMKRMVTYLESHS